jgi:hypothetical protein
LFAKAAHQPGRNGVVELGMIIVIAFKHRSHGRRDLFTLYILGKKTFGTCLKQV